MKRLLLFITLTLSTINLWGMRKCMICPKTTPASYKVTSELTFTQQDDYSTTFKTICYYCEQHRNNENVHLAARKAQYELSGTTDPSTVTEKNRQESLIPIEERLVLPPPPAPDKPENGRIKLPPTSRIALLTVCGVIACVVILLIKRHKDSTKKELEEDTQETIPENSNKEMIVTNPA